MIWDLLIVGAGPAGAACATFCARAGLKVLVLERAEFPRDKVCGDCLNPLCWPVLDRLGVTDAILATPHSALERIEIATGSGISFSFPANTGKQGQITIQRSLFDAIIAENAKRNGAVIHHSRPVSTIERKRNGIYQVTSGSETFSARKLVAADGRNSTVARLLGLLPAARRDRVAIQTHLAAPSEYGNKVLLKLLPFGCCGVASIGNGRLNLCLVGQPDAIPRLRKWAIETWSASADPAEWRTVTPLSRAPLPSAEHEVILIGDAARVVEPFTGEGIYYALASGELAAALNTGEMGPAEYCQAHRKLYAGRLWINEVAKLAVLYPDKAAKLLGLMQNTPQILEYLTRRVVGPTN